MPVRDTKAPAGAIDLRALAQNPTPEQAGDAARLPVAPNERRFLAHHPSAWELGEVNGKPVYLPQLTPILVAPGAGGMRTKGSNQEESRVWHSALQERRDAGWVILAWNDDIPADALPDGMPPGGYLRSYPARHPVNNAQGLFWTEVWNVPVATLPGDEQRFEYDRARFNVWRLSLVESGRIAPPLPHVITALRDSAEKRIGNVPVAIPADVREAMLAPRKANADRHKKAAVPAAKGAA